MRITGGAFGGRRLHVPKTSDIRPMRDQVRTALFNILADVVEGSAFLDLFAGTGSVGLEALSRGAKRAVFVDRNREALQLLRLNIEDLDVSERAQIVSTDAFEALAQLERAEDEFDLVFVGPPYGADLVPRMLEQLATWDILGPDAIVTAEIFKKESVESAYGPLGMFDDRTYGDNRLLFYRLSRTSE